MKLIIHKNWKYQSCIMVLLTTLLINCGVEPIKLKNTKWKAIKVTLDSINSLNKNEALGYHILDSLLKSSSLHSEFYDGYSVTYFDGKIPDTTSYVIKLDTLFFKQNNLRDTEIILKKTDETLITKSMSGLTVYLKRVKQ